MRRSDVRPAVFFGHLRRAIVYESRAGRAAEIVGWANFLTSLVAAGFAYWAERSVPFAIAALVAAFVLLRLALVHRATVWVAGALGTASVAAAAGALAWTFGHAIESPSAPVIAAGLGAFLAGVVPAAAYLRIARSRAGDQRDSLVAISAIPPSA